MSGVANDEDTYYLYVFDQRPGVGWKEKATSKIEHVALWLFENRVAACPSGTCKLLKGEDEIARWGNAG